jgi:nucleoside-diphosphate-sugar epimerase
MADQPISGKYFETDRIFDDATDDIYAYEKERQEKQYYLQRASELGVVDAGLETGVKVLVIMSPTIYGIGTGKFNDSSIQVPAYVRVTLANGQGLYVGEGKGIWDNVHVEDLVSHHNCSCNLLQAH